MKPRILFSLLGIFVPVLSAATVTVESPWVRATVPGQSATGAYMTLRSSGNAAVVGVTTPVAGLANIHQMTLEGGVMKMRELKRLSLPAGKPVELKSGSYHIMIMDLKQSLSAGDSVPLTLRIESGGMMENLEVKAAVRALGVEAEGHHHHH